jgi:selenide,water dikinase
MVDDPYVYGQIAAANALSDVYAMGGEPKLALNLLCFPACLPLKTVLAILEGGHDKAREAGCVIAGGHTIEDVGPKYGLCVTGFAEKGRILTNSGARPGDVLVLTKPLGTGILTTALKAGLLSDADYRRLVEVMTALNRAARDCMEGLKVHACTDVTGFSLIGHAGEMARGSGVTLVLEASKLPVLEPADEFAQMGMIPAGAYRNREFMEGRVCMDGDIPLHMSDVMFDPQTSGGLLISMPEGDARALLGRLSEFTPWARQIGYVKERGEWDIEVRP